MITDTLERAKKGLICLGVALGCAIVLACASLTPAYADNAVDRFSDVNNDWYTSHVQWVYDTGLMGGYGYDTFGVGNDHTRAELATVLWRYAVPDAAACYAQSEAVNRTDMTDVENGAYYTEAVNWAYDEGIFTGFDEGNGDYIFGPNESVTREQAITVLWRYLDGQRPDDWTFFNVYPDKDNVAEWSNWAIGWALQNGIISGTKHDNGYWIEPDRTITREEMAKILHTSITNESRESISIIELRAYREYQMGKWYQWGAAGPETFDCSGLVGYCCTGVYGNHWCWTGSIINWNHVSNPVGGDICVVHNNSHQHCGIYIGDDKYINAPGSGKQIRINDVPSYMSYVRY